MVLMKKVALLLVILSILSFPLAGNAYDAIVAFGDSDTDTGNLPSSPPEYWNKRFSNGPVWIEYLAQLLGLAYDSSANFAVSGEEAADLGTQIDRFPGPGSASDVIYVIWAGSNDILNHFTTNGSRDSAWELQIQSIVSSLTVSCDLLYQKGARKILMLNVPDLTRSPSMTTRYSATYRSYIAGKIRTTNSRLANAIAGVKSSHPGLEVYLLDAHRDVNYVTDHYTEYGFVNSTAGALNTTAFEDKSFDGPGANYIFWDKDHYTTKMHSLIAQWAQQVLPTQPPPTPHVELVSPANGQSFTAPANINLAASVNANGKTIIRVEFLRDDALLGTDASAPYEYSWAATQTGSFAIRARVVYDSGQTVTSDPAQVTLAPPTGNPLPSPWQHLDVGAVGRAGDAYTTTAGEFVVIGSGADIYSTSDEFHLAYRPLTGDGALIARVVSMQNTDGYAKACLVFRGSLAANAANVVEMVTPSFGTGFQTRAANAGSTTYAVGAALKTPCWLKLERTGSTIKGYCSTDGVKWTLEGTATVSLPATAYAGIGVTSHNDALLNTAVFDNLKIETAAAPLAPRLSATRLSDGTVRLLITGSGAAAYVTEFSTDMTTWISMSTNSATSGSAVVLDGTAKNQPQRYYRVAVRT